MTELPDADEGSAAVHDGSVPWAAPDRAYAPATDTAPVAPQQLRPHVPAEPVSGSRAGLGSVPLRPLALGDILDGTFAAIRRNPRTVVGLAALLVTIQELLILGVQALTGDLPDASFGAEGGLSFTGGTGLVASLAIRAVVGAVLTGMIVVVVSEDVLGRGTTIGAVWGRMRAHLVRLVTAALLVGLLPYVGLLLLIVPGVVLWGGWALAMPALVLEGTGPIGAIRRSWRLVRPAFWRMWSIRLLSVVLGYVMEYLVAVPFALVAVLTTLAAGVDSGDPIPPYTLAVVALGAIVGGTLVQPFYAGVLALLYVDRRMRAEGMDITLQLDARSIGRGRSGPAVAEPGTGTSSTGTGTSSTGTRTSSTGAGPGGTGADARTVAGTGAAVPPAAAQRGAR